MPAKTHTVSYRSLEVDDRAGDERAEVRPAEGFGRKSNCELGGGEGGDGQADAVDGNGVAEVAVGEDGRGVGDGEG